MPFFSKHRSGLSCAGFTLGEAGLVLGVIGLVVGGIWVAGSKVNQSVQITTLTEQVHQIVDNVRGLYVGVTVLTNGANRGMFVDNTQANVNGAACGVATFNSRLSCLGVYPADMTGGAGNDAYHVWDQALAGGSVLVLPRDINFAVAGTAATSAISFGVQLLNLPVDVCVQMVARQSTPDQSYALKAVLFFDAGGAMTANYVTSSRPPDWTLAGLRTTILPVTPTQAVAACTGAGAVEWVFDLRP